MLKRAALSSEFGKATQRAFRTGRLGTYGQRAGAREVNTSAACSGYVGGG